MAASGSELMAIDILGLETQTGLNHPLNEYFLARDRSQRLLGRNHGSWFPT